MLESSARLIMETTGLNINNNFIHSTINTIFSSSDNAIFAGTFFGGLYRSDDNGTNWVAINNGLSINGFTDGHINDIIENSAGYLFTSAGYWESEVYRSSDGGENWEQSLGYSQTGSSYIGLLQLIQMAMYMLAHMQN